MWNLIIFILAVISIVIFGVVVVGFYTNLNKLKNRVLTAWSYINEEMERKTILIDDLVKTIKRTVDHENALEEVIYANYELLDTVTVQEIAEANFKLNIALDNLYSILENYPNILTNADFLKLTEELRKTEDLIDEDIHLYTEMAYVYNNKCHTFPGNVVANYFGFEEAEFFELEMPDNEAIKN
ncbi:MAG TPA: LemA family protein [Methanobacterium sp.]|nr:LemA family protein [Methanobacterium sp.]